MTVHVMVILSQLSEKQLIYCEDETVYLISLKTLVTIRDCSGTFYADRLTKNYTASFLTNIQIRMTEFSKQTI